MPQVHSRAAATAAAIERAALDLARRDGYANLTVDMICASVGISQRTFFNHFPTKDDAILGRQLPTVDEGVARRFLVGDGPILIDALGLITLPGAREDLASFEQRMEVIAQSPQLLARQMSRIAALEAELREIVSMRLAKEQPALDQRELGDRSALIVQLLAGVVRFLGSLTDSTPDDALARARLALTSVLANEHGRTQQTL